eukprot:CAMPEP_0170296130 /NCGR_PEP_ID=MMETSP0116_2-20130129/48199_1 /TAXON_ID=400756 /ORGANISM="Durinskia baltica, Strain CSIRO CS-38" /LENGTH=70 /DNA_ID=CAMNT_0010547701 /DNA_START=78 /DNA_END=287 /DNA_ORIENTATION=-
MVARRGGRHAGVRRRRAESSAACGDIGAAGLRVPATGLRRSRMPLTLWSSDAVATAPASRPKMPPHLYCR